ncbi:Proline-specific peptidase [Candidatus Trichorickettsia mobilis]|uniref:Proline-specific peptidase n=1 Tax=Candidatus Trichorickettsia mobilis TaxID=1346319 RepID=A0ABZ0UUY4_9RICK|nr:alpha/beta fold hydrolase [Candidatus Trichorickettsia mobilis]WPY01426.1 Proline-specific peptidase [Candidatus Trichorickettsia mobilis]
MGIIRKLHVLVACTLLLFAVTGCHNIKDNNAISSHQQVSPLKSGYISVESGKLFYQRFGKGDPTIVVHGGPGLDQSYLLPQMLELAKDHEVIFYDQRGSGRSLETSIDPKYISSDQFAKDLETLRLELGLKNVAIIGHSWGGFLSMNYAIKYPDNVSSLILVSSAPANYEDQKAFADEFNKRTQGIKHKIDPLFNDKTLSALNRKQINQAYRDLFSVYFKEASNVHKLTLDMSKESAIGGFNVLSLMLKTTYFTPDSNLVPALGKLNVPTFLIIHGNQDIIPVGSALTIQKAIPGSKVVYLNDCGHFPYIEKPNEFFSSIRSFLSEVGKQ